MKQFGSGIIGCVICVLALMGTILGGFVLDIDKDTRETTDYNYITDITGLFDTDETPRYIDYNPSTNFIGYPEQTVEYVDSTVPNNYRYVADSGLTSVIDYDSYFTGHAGSDIDGGNSYSPIFINYTGTRYNLGTATAWKGITYNAIVDGKSDGRPCMTTFYTMATEKGLAHGEYNITNLGYPVIFYNGTSSLTETFPNYTVKLYDSVFNIDCKRITIDDTSFPTRITYNNDSTVTAYNGSTQLWTKIATQVYVVYDYGIMSGGSYTSVNVNTNIKDHLSGSFTVTNSTTFGSLWQPDTHAVFDYTTLYLYYSGTEYNFGEERRGNGNLRYNAILIKDPTNTKFCATPIASILYAALGTTSIPNSDSTTPSIWYEVEIENHGNPIFIGRTFADYRDNPTLSGEIIVSDDMIADRLRIFYNPTLSSGGYVQWYRGETYIGSDEATDRCVLWGYIPNNQNSPNINTTFNVVMGSNINLGSGDSLTTTSVPSSLIHPLMAFNYTGTFGYDFGPTVTDHNLTYNGNIPTSMIYTVDTGTGTTSVDGPRINAYPLTALLNRINVPNSTTAEVEITYPTQANPNTVPMFFMHNQIWTQTTWSLNNNVIKGYATTFTDANLPTRFTWNTQTNWVTIYKGDTVLYSDNASNIAVVYNMEGTNGVTQYSLRLHVQGLIQRTGENISVGTIDNSSAFDYSLNNFTPINTSPTWEVYRINAYFKYNGTAYNNMGSPTNVAGITVTTRLPNTTTTDDKTVPYVTSLDKILSGDYTGYSKITFNVTQGTHPIFFYTGSFSYQYSENVIHDQGGSVTYHYNNYFATIGDNSIVTKIEYTPATETCTLYRNNTVTYVGSMNNVTVIFKYDILESNTWNEVTDQSATISGLGMPIPVYAYMDPTKGVILNMSSATWENGYENNDIYITMVRERAGTINELSIIADTSSITVRTVGNTMTAYITKYDGTTATKTIGTWAACQVHINASEGTVSLTPLQGPISYTNNVPENATTTTWAGWYNGGDITQLTIATTQQSMRFSITNTSVFLNTYGVVMQDPSINVSSYFPEYEEWRLNFYSFALVGDSMTVNGQTFNVDEDQKITVTGEDGKTITGTLSNIYVTEKDDHTYFTFADGKDTVDLGETTSSTVSFAGRWYFTTGLYEGVDGVEEYYDWNLDGNFHANLAEACLIFLGLLVLGVIIGKVTLDLSLKSIDGIILISVTVIALIIAGGAI